MERSETCFDTNSRAAEAAEAAAEEAARDIAGDGDLMDQLSSSRQGTRTSALVDPADPRRCLWIEGWSIESIGD
jgi:hypothetical protein